MEQPNGCGEKIQNQNNPASNPDSPAAAAGSQENNGTSHTEAVTPTPTPKVDPKEGENVSVQVPIAKDGEGSADEDKATAQSVKTPKSVRWSEQLVSESTFTTSSDDPHASAYMSGSDNPYVSHPQDPNASSTSLKEKMDTVRNVLGRWGKNVKEAAKKAEDLAGNTWQHLKTSPSFADAAMGRLAHSTKVIAEGGYEKIFHSTFETVPQEQLRDSYACYLSTSAGPVMGALYVSTEKLAFCSDNPLPYKNGGQTDWSYYKVVIPLNQLKAVNPSTSRMNPSEKYIQIISVDNHEFWYMGFLNYESAVTVLQEVMQTQDLQAV